MDNVGVVITLLARTVPMQQWSVERELRKAVLEKFEKENIEIPYPHGFIKKMTKGELYATLEMLSR